MNHDWDRGLTLYVFVGPNLATRCPPPPRRELGFWVRGLPAPGVIDDLILDERGRAVRFSQSGWDVDYRAYREVDDLILPAKVFIAARPGTVRVTAADGADLGDQLSVRISIRTWNDEPEWAERNR